MKLMYFLAKVYVRMEAHHRHKQMQKDKKEYFSINIYKMKYINFDEEVSTLQKLWATKANCTFQIMKKSIQFS